jgi:hypothetical protein
MSTFTIQPIPTSALPDVARFLRRWRADRDKESSIERQVPEDVASTERRLRWLLVDNPAAAGVDQHGFCIRDDEGAIRGLDLAFPNALVVGDRRVMGLCSGAFFVDPEARSLGFFLFKRHLRSPGYALFYSTSCNANSGPVWRTVGGCPVRGSDAEYIVPLKLDVMLPAVLADKSGGRVTAGLSRLLGQCVTPVMQLLAQKSTGLTIEPCRDWDKLAALSQRHRPAEYLTTDRSPAFLAWRYGPGSPNHPCDVLLFRDGRGREGWFALGPIVRGRQAQIHGRILMDAVWPRDAMSFRELFPAVLRQAVGADALFLQPRIDVDYSECSRWIIPRRGPARIHVVRAKDGDAPKATLDLVPADGDSAFRISVWPDSF